MEVLKERERGVDVYVRKYGGAGGCSLSYTDKKKRKKKTVC